jgi:hypothetical protein
MERAVLAGRRTLSLALSLGRERGFVGLSLLHESASLR